MRSKIYKMILLLGMVSLQAPDVCDIGHSNFEKLALSYQSGFGLGEQKMAELVRILNQWRIIYDQANTDQTLSEGPQSLFVLSSSFSELESEDCRNKTVIGKSIQQKESRNFLIPEYIEHAFNLGLNPEIKMTRNVSQPLHTLPPTVIKPMFGIIILEMPLGCHDEKNIPVIDYHIYKISND